MKMYLEGPPPRERFCALEGEDARGRLYDIMPLLRCCEVVDKTRFCSYCRARGSEAGVVVECSKLSGVSRRMLTKQPRSHT